MEEEKNGKKINILGLVIFVVGIILLCVGSVIAFMDKPKEEPESEEPPKEENTVYTFTKDDEFQSATGDVIVKAITKVDDEESYTMEYNGKVANMEKVQEDDLYVSFSGDFPGEGGQCFTKHLLINKKTKMIEDSKGLHIRFIKTEKGYYFISGKCEPLDYPGDVYNEKWNLLGMYLGDTVLSNGNIYVSKSKDSHRIKGVEIYDNNGLKINDLDDYYYSSAVIYGDECYAVAFDDTTVYVVNLSNTAKLKITERSTDRDSEYSFYDRMKVEGSNIIIDIEEGSFVYNLETNTITQK